jgi:glucose-1-phosphate thymidylyltransferase
MKAIILAAGYATRLRPLTDSVAKPLLLLADRPMIEYLCERIAEADEIDAVHVVTNGKFAASFDDWARGYRGRQPVVVHNDGTASAKDRLGAIGDIQLTVERAALGNDDLLVVAGDNLVDFSLAECVHFWRGKVDSSVIALHDCHDLELTKQYSVVDVDSQDRVLSFIEKPKSPRSSLIGTAVYVYPRAHVPLIAQYLREGQPPDQPGNLISWLCTRVPVYGYRFAGNWLDIGNESELLRADNLLRERRGLLRRGSYRP